MTASYRSGWDLSDETVRASLLKETDFVDFEIAPTSIPPQIQRKIELLPVNWQDKAAQEFNQAWDKAEGINRAIECHYQLEAPFYASVDDERRVWIRKK